ncbi:MAG TPA: MmcQ/YjbR family DNA-binding protein [Candidatus Dormibacteraeota bacterium]|nr:MmcQ/YjbR family DNA-binding protein [Candidatus Dormibacteraeota bacterium]
MIGLREAREIALALPGAVEADHWGNPSFRVGGKIFATVPESTFLNVMIDPFQVDGLVRDYPDCCAPLLWGKNVRGVTVNLRHASRPVVSRLLEEAWRRKAPSRLSGTAVEVKVRRGNHDRERPARGRGEDETAAVRPVE